MKWLSRKFLYPILFGVLVSINSLLDLGLDNNALALIANVVIAFILGESVVDLINTYSKNKK